MIDASRSPRPLWRRALTMLAVAAAIAVLAWAIWVKELHHPTPHIRSISALVSVGSVCLPVARRPAVD